MKYLKMVWILVFQTRWICFCRRTARRWDEHRMWTQCLDCGRESKGIQLA